MTITDTDELAGQEAGNTPPETDESSSLSDEGGQSSSTTEQVDPVLKELQDRLSQAGRETKSAQERARRAEEAATAIASQLAATNQRLESIGATLSAEEKARQEAYLNSLPADQREREELRLTNKRLETRLSALEGARTAPQPTEEQERAATIRRAQQMAESAAVEFGLDEGEQIAWNDPRLSASGAWESPEAYNRQVRILARKISLGKEPAVPSEGATHVAGNTTKKGSPAPTTPDVAKIAADAAKAAVAEVLGNVGGGPNSPRPAAMIEDRTPSEQAYQSTLRSYTPTAGPKATRQELKAQLAKAEAAYNKAAGGR